MYPIKGGGVHVLQRGAEGAFRELTAALEKDPNDLKSRWLLNIAAMTLGKYPDDVPEKWRVAPSTFSSEYDIGRFYDVATDAGLVINNHSGGVIMEDFDGDGLLDLMVSGSGPHDQLRLLHNNGDGTFTDRTREAGLTGETGGLNIVQSPTTTTTGIRTCWCCAADGGDKMGNIPCRCCATTAMERSTT